MGCRINGGGFSIAMLVISSYIEVQLDPFSVFDAFMCTSMIDCFSSSSAAMSSKQK